MTLPSILLSLLHQVAKIIVDLGTFNQHKSDFLESVLTQSFVEQKKAKNKQNESFRWIFTRPSSQLWSATNKW